MPTSSSRRLHLTTALNGYSSTEFINSYRPSSRPNYHEKISTILNSEPASRSTSPTWKEINAKILRDRRSFYDNYNEETDRSRSRDPDQGATNNSNNNQYRFSNNNKPLPQVYKSERHMHVEEASTPTNQSPANDRDDFDDLIDLTHRIPKKVVIKVDHWKGVTEIQTDKTPVQTKFSY